MFTLWGLTFRGMYMWVHYPQGWVNTYPLTCVCKSYVKTLTCNLFFWCLMRWYLYKCHLIEQLTLSPFASTAVILDRDNIYQRFLFCPILYLPDTSFYLVLRFSVCLPLSSWKRGNILFFTSCSISLNIDSCKGGPYFRPHTQTFNIKKESIKI